VVQEEPGASRAPYKVAQLSRLRSDPPMREGLLGQGLTAMVSRLKGVGGGLRPAARVSIPTRAERRSKGRLSVPLLPTASR
jgi:hypothetical protein